MKQPKYRRLTHKDRCQISHAMETKLSLTRIAKLVGKSKSTISRELRRNAVWQYKYYANTAHEMAQDRRRHCHAPYRVVGDLQSTVVHFLLERWSPERIAGRLKIEQDVSLSRQTIYNYIKNKDRGLRATLPRFNRRGVGRCIQRRQSLQHAHHRSIHERGRGANLRQHFGDWERDGMFGAHQKQLLVCVDRRSRLLRIGKIEELNADWVDELTLRLTYSVLHKVRSVTNDNGSYFKNKNERFKFPVYFCDPRKPQQRGTVENTIGQLRSYITRKTDLDTLDQAALDEIADKLNHRPLKVLGYKTPFEVFYNQTVALLN